MSFCSVRSLKRGVVQLKAEDSQYVAATALPEQFYVRDLPRVHSLHFNRRRAEEDQDGKIPSQVVRGNNLGVVLDVGDRNKLWNPLHSLLR